MGSACSNPSKTVPNSSTNLQTKSPAQTELPASTKVSAAPAFEELNITEPVVLNISDPVLPNPVPESGSGLRISVFLGSIFREGRLCERVGKFVTSFLEKRQHIVSVVDPKELNLGQLVKPVQLYHSPEQIPPALSKINTQIETADCFVVVCPEYNSSISPTLVSLLSHFPPKSYADRPVAIVCYSNGLDGGIRAAEQLREFLAELKMISVPAYVVMPFVQEMITEDGSPIENKCDALLEEISKMTLQLEWFVAALNNHKKIAPVPT